MKSLKQIFLFSVLALFVAFSVKAQSTYKVTDDIPTSVKLIGKYHAVITFLETKEFYKPGMSEDEFVQTTTSCLEDETLIEMFTPYMRHIYNYHVNKMTSDEVYDKEDSNSFASLSTSLEKYMQDPNIRKELSFKKPKWFNWLRKAIDWLDDHWKE